MFGSQDGIVEWGVGEGEGLRSPGVNSWNGALPGCVNCLREKK